MDNDALIGLAKDWGIALVIALVVFGVWGLIAPGPKQSGNAPELLLHDLQGEMFSLEDADHAVTVVNFWATWCAPCRQEIPEFSRFAKDHPDVGVYGVSVDEDISTERLAMMSERLGIRYPVLHDQTGFVASRWGVTGYPTTFILDANHEIVSVKMGALSGHRLADLVEEAR
jgi:cytochrome c-type biogenesis protein